MRYGILLMMLMTCSAVAKDVLTAREAERIADAIYVIEGGRKAKVPYGILSVKVRDERHARQVCLNTIRNNHVRWKKAGAKGEFLNFLADRYCPPSDAAGNRNWKKNIQAVLKKKSVKPASSKPPELTLN